MDPVQKAFPTLTIDLRGDQPVVQQIINALRRCLLQGELKPGDLLPSSRALARDLGVHFNTVAQAYRELEAEGWLALRRRAGTVVIERDDPALDRDQARVLAEAFVEALRDLMDRYEAHGVDRGELVRRATEALNERGNHA